MAPLDLGDSFSGGDDLPRRPRPPWRLAGAATWAAAGAVAGGGAWWAGLTVARAAVSARALAPDPETPVLAAAAALGGATAAIGLLLGGVVGLAHGGLARAAVTGLLLAALGGVAGALSPVAAAAAGGLPPVVSSALVWAAAGLVAGAVGYTWGRVADETAEEAPVPAPPAAPARRRRAGRLGRGAAGRVLPTAAVAVACVVGAMVGTPSPAGWAVLAVGVLGLAVTWALVGQERRLRELERRLPPARAGRTRRRSRPRPDGR